MATKGISGLAVAMATVGGFLMYVGIRDVSFQDALREVVKGKVQPIESKTGSTSQTAASFIGKSTSASQLGLAPNDDGEDSSGGVAEAGYKTSGGGLPSLVNAVYAYKGDKYSQSKRWQSGYSDCSSFVGKGLKKLGITPPGASTTYSYLGSSQWKKISRSQAGAGDLACNSGHVAIFINNSQGIGQQNSRSNVKMDSMSNLMSGTGSFVCLRYAGGGSSKNVAQA